MKRFNKLQGILLFSIIILGIVFVITTFLAQHYQNVMDATRQWVEQTDVYSPNFPPEVEAGIEGFDNAQVNRSIMVYTAIFTGLVFGITLGIFARDIQEDKKAKVKKKKREKSFSAAG